MELNYPEGDIVSSLNPENGASLRRSRRSFLTGKRTHVTLHSTLSLRSPDHNLSRSSSRRLTLLCAADLLVVVVSFIESPKDEESLCLALGLNK